MKKDIGGYVDVLGLGERERAGSRPPIGEVNHELLGPLTQHIARQLAGLSLEETVEVRLPAAVVATAELSPDSPPTDTEDDTVYGWNGSAVEVGAGGYVAVHTHPKHSLPDEETTT